MELPKINSIRKKDITLNGKKITLFPWTNMQLINYEEELENKSKIDAINEILLQDNIRCKQRLTLTEKRYVLVELYKLSKSSILDIEYTCECGKDSKYAINLEKSVSFKELKERIVKTKEFTFNLRRSSVYEFDLDNKDKNKESLKYFLSFIDSFIYQNKTFEVQDLDEMVEWFNTEMPSSDFNEFMDKFNKIKPDIEIDVVATCEHCQKETRLDFRLENFL